MTAFHHFELKPSLVAASNYQEAVATLQDMDKFDLCHLPYHECLVTVRVASFLNDKGWFVQDAPDASDDVAATMLLLDRFSWDPPTGEPIFAGDPKVVLVHDNGARRTVDMNAPPTNKFATEFVTTMKTLCAYTAMLLVTALATTNTQKQIAVNHRASRGIGNGKFKGPHSSVIYLSTTTLQPPSFGPTGTGISPRPHLRRGHIHTFLTGEGRTESIRKFVNPIFVNGQGPMPARTYKVNG